ncbi:MAG: AEC family transporter [Candidatus Hadarchaeales archaeon]
MLEGYVSRIALMLILLGAGMAARRVKFFRPVFEVINTVVIWAMLPALIFSSITSQSLRIHDHGSAILLAFLGLGFCFVISTVATSIRRLNREASVAITLNASFMNVTHLGLPAVYAIVGPRGLSPASFYAMVIGILHLIFGTALASAAARRRVSARSILESLLTFPPAFALIVALLFVGFKAYPPDEMMAVLDYIASPSLVLMLLLVGYQMPLVDPRKHLQDLTAVGVIRLVICPLVTYAFMGLLDPSETVRKSIMIQATMPPAIFNMILAHNFKLDVQHYGVLVFYLTLASMLAAVPIVGYVMM